MQDTYTNIVLIFCIETISCLGWNCHKSVTEQFEYKVELNNGTNVNHIRDKLEGLENNNYIKVIQVTILYGENIEKEQKSLLKSNNSTLLRMWVFVNNSRLWGRCL